MSAPPKGTIIVNEPLASALFGKVRQSILAFSAAPAEAGYKDEFCKTVSAEIDRSPCYSVDLTLS